MANNLIYDKLISNNTQILYESGGQQFKCVQKKM